MIHWILWPDMYVDEILVCLCDWDYVKCAYIDPPVLVLDFTLMIC